MTAPSHPEAAVDLVTTCEFDSGPLHGLDIDVPFDETGDLPTLLVTDEGDYWSLYVLIEPTRYRYDGEPTPTELDGSPRVPEEGRR